MLSMSRNCCLLGLALAIGVLASAGTMHGQAAKKPITKSVTFKSYDGVELSGTLYPNPGGKREAVVLMLHDFDLKKGGNSQKPEGWAELAAALQADGYAVLMFD